MYLTYDEYEDMGGTLDETAFNNIEFDAESYVDYHTFNRLRDDTIIDLRVKRCIFDLITLIDKKNNAEGLNAESGTTIASQSNDGVSIKYNVMSSSSAYEILRRDVARTIKRYLTGMKNERGRIVLYRGVYPNE